MPTWDWHGAWGNPEVYYRAHRYITTMYPFWNASGGADHVWTIARDAAACATPWGSLLEELGTSIILSNWGGVSGLSGAEEVRLPHSWQARLAPQLAAHSRGGRTQERCFRPNWDIVLPGTLKAGIVQMSPWLLPPAVQAPVPSCLRTSPCVRVSVPLRQSTRPVSLHPSHTWLPPHFSRHAVLCRTHSHLLASGSFRSLSFVAPRAECLQRSLLQEGQFSKRTTKLFFYGALCWKTDQIVRKGNMRKLEAKCARSYGQPGFLSRYSFGLRYEIFKKFHKADGFRLYATDFPSSLPSQRVDVNDEILHSSFCLCPSGTGWGMRVFHVLVLGCVPVLTQHDGVHPPVAQVAPAHLKDVPTIHNFS